MSTSFANIARSVVIAFGCAFALGASACGSGPFGGEEQPAEKTGTLQAALQTTGEDGATYRFPAGSRLSVTRTSSPFTSSYPIDGAETTLSKTLGVGTYTLDLSFGAWPAPVLERSVDGNTWTPVPNVIWTDPKPVSFTINENAPTAVVLHFSVPGLGDVTFATGNLDVSLEVVDADFPRPAYIGESGFITVTHVNWADPNATYATQFLTLAVNDVRYQAFTVSPAPMMSWTLEGDAACIPVLYASSGAMPGEETFSRRFTELSGGTGHVCIQNDGTNDLYDLRLEKNGPLPATHTPYFPGMSYRVVLHVTARIGDVFDGTTLQQSLFEAPRAITSGQFEHSITDTLANVTVSSMIGTFQASGGTVVMSTP